MFDILGLVGQMERQGADVTHLEIGDTEGFDNTVLREFVVARARSERFGYSPSGGEPRLREVVAAILEEELGRTLEVERIAIAPANFLISQALASVTYPGSKVLLPDPGFPTYRLSAEFLDLDARYYNTISKHLGLDGNDHQDWVESEPPVVVIINNPNNPLGHGAPWDHYRDLIDTARRAGSWLLFDETYKNLCYDENMGQPPDVDDERCIRIYTMSKEHAVPGLRIGYCVAAPAVVDVINRFTSLTVSCLPSFVQLAVADYLESPMAKSYVSELRYSMTDRLAYLRDAFETAGLSSSLVIQPNAGFYAMIKTSNERTAAEALLHEDGVATCPGSGFGSNCTESIRVSLAGKSDEVREGIDRLVRVLADHLQVDS
jgi:aspartate/methionine/tyrosine aminotransferase